jgi:hypothetical protein
LSIALNISNAPTPEAYQNTARDSNDGICCPKSTAQGLCQELRWSVLAGVAGARDRERIEAGQQRDVDNVASVSPSI